MSDGETASGRVEKQTTASRPRLIAMGNAVTVLAAAVLMASSLACRETNESIVIANAHQVTNDERVEVHPNVSPDGKTIAYAAGPWTKSRIYVEQLSPGGTAVALTDTSQAAQWPRFSPDGTSILYTAGNHSYIIPAHGGIPSSFGGNRNLVFCSWSNAGDKVACRDFDTAALVVLGSDGENAQDVPDTGGKVATIAPVFSPDDKLIAYVRDGRQFLSFTDVVGNVTPSSIWLTAVAGGTPVKVTDDTHLNTSPQWTRDGSLLYVSSRQGGRDVFLQHISKDLSTKGDPVKLTNGLNAHTISLSLDGITLAYSVLNTSSALWRTAVPNAPVESPMLEQVTSIPLKKAAREKPPLLRDAPFSTIAPDGQEAVVVTAAGVICRNCPGGMYWVRLDGSAHKEVDMSSFMKVVRDPGEGAWSDDSRHAYMSMREMDGTSSIWQLPVKGDPGMRIVHFTDPSRQFSQMAIDVDNKFFYVTLGSRQSDIWTMKLKKQ